MASFANFGVGLGAAVRGFGEGMKIGRAIKNVRNEREIEGITREGMAEASTQRDQAVNGLIQTQDMGGGAQQFSVNGQNFTNREDAQRAAERQVGSTLDYFNRTISPRIREAYVQQGNMDMAQRWDSYTQNQQTRRGMRSFAHALRSRTMGDEEGALKHMIEAYNNDSYFGDGYRISDYEPIRDGDRVVGYRGTFEGPDGRSTTQDFRKGDLSALVNMGIGMLSPDQAFATTLAQQQAADKARADAAAKEADRRATTEGQVTVEGVRGANARVLEGDRARNQSALQSQRDASALDRTVIGAQVGAAAAGDRRSAELGADVDALRGIGASEDQVRGAVTRRVAGGSSGTDPGSAAWDAEARNNPLFSTMSDAERQEAVRRSIVGRQSAAGLAAGAAPSTGSGAPAPGVIMVDPARPATQPPARNPNAVPLIDPATGRTIYR